MFVKILETTSRLEKRLRLKVARGKKINVLFLEPSSNTSKVSLLKELSSDSHFNVSVLSHDQSDISKSLYKFTGVKHILGGEIEEVIEREEIDILFLDNPHYHFSFLRPTHDFYKELSRVVFENTLICYIPYAYISVASHEAYTDYFHKFSWRFFLESHFHLLESNRFSNGFERLPNQVVTGHPYVDPYLTDQYDFDATQKRKGQSMFRITWCPHHNPIFYGGISIAEQAAVLQNLLEANKDIEIYFRPHPNLLAALRSQIHLNSKDYQTLLSRELADSLETYWLKHERVTYYDRGPIYQLFKNSDLIVHNCGGYQMEAVISGAPVINLVNKGILNDHILQYKAFQTFCSSKQELEEALRGHIEVGGRQFFRLTGHEEIPLAANLIKRNIKETLL